ncbi:hypothetical protein AcW1_004896 [Taiwanofungus camphoratus]|nr:hypothetical protein AcV5_001283 [Antrodia cinnamomea]KAI0960366.1 hypothetical protein AcW1_004896 [Antrodia cinnamomea]
MGRWTLAYHDDVLGSKVKNLVSGAIKRIRLEKGEPSISYEAFAEELDEGDSFTASLVETLVKELAERRMRPNPIDRRLISERTAKSLRMQATALHVYRGRQPGNRLASRRSFVIDEERDIFGGAGGADSSGTEDNGDDGPSEGVQLNSNLYDAYRAPSYDLLDALHPVETTPLATGSPDTTEAAHDSFGITSPRSASPPALAVAYRTIPWSHSSTLATLARQNSIRRPARSRTVDFNEFTHRRRSTIRQSSEQDQDIGRSESSSDGVWRFRLREHQHALPLASASASSSSDPPPARRFFPLNSWSQTRRRHEVGGAFPWSPDPFEPSSLESNQPLEPTAPPASGQSSSHLWYTLTNTEPPAWLPERRASITDINEVRRQVVAPRLRRGGVRPPESLLSRYASPVEDPERIHRESISSAERPERSTIGNDEAAPLSPSIGRDVFERVRELTPQIWTRLGEEMRQLPTPRSDTPAIEAGDDIP